ncbi:DUF1311 domain-containing protein [Pseudomonas cichorii]|uniref:lysozyme inhibitor LprI family protein n=1 Tax=Pseudomonas cichorii TaxID=36746 RepID=UPI0018E5E53B|nr:lysozyme inhibitor LprI family protein [Pseudomonas cichorii]MBI6852017.1 DUF1311 domain-containing protein [Pseudomonas cichorii]
MKKTIMPFLMLVLLGLPPAKAECIENTVSQEVDVCAKSARDSADARLNSSYRNLLIRIKDQYQSDGKRGGDFATKLKESQRAWLKLRDSNCVLEAFEVEAGKPAYMTTVNNCVAKMSLERSGYLDRLLPDI